MTAVRLCHLYPDQMNIYADRGNIAVIADRLRRRGHRLDITEVSGGDTIDAHHDLYYLGGGQDRDQALVADDLAATKADTLRQAADAGAAMLFVCGGIQLAGHGYTDTDGTRLPGTGVLDLDTFAGDTRLIGDLVIQAELDGHTREVVGYENHAGRTTLGTGVRPLGRVLHGHGNDGRSGDEGAVRDHVIGTYLHGPLLPKNPWLADVLLTWALSHAGDDSALPALDDELERRAHQAAVARAGVKR